MDIHAIGLLSSTRSLELLQHLSSNRIVPLVLRNLFQQLLAFLRLLPLLREFVRCLRNTALPADLRYTLSKVGEGGEEVSGGLTRGAVPSTRSEELAASICGTKVDLATFVQNYDLVEDLMTKIIGICKKCNERDLTS